MPKIHCIVVAAGSGTRFGGTPPKQFVDLDGMPVVMHAVRALREALPHADATIVLAPGDMDLWQSLCMRHGFRSPRMVAGGASRFESVRNAMLTVAPDTDFVLVHDGARPLITKELTHRLVDALTPDTDGALPAVPLTDSIRLVGLDGASQAVDRGRYRAVQTPQAFHFARLKQAYGSADPQGVFTDDASVSESAGYGRIALVEGDPYNIKITNPIDIKIAESIVKYLKSH